MHSISHSHVSRSFCSHGNNEQLFSLVTCTRAGNAIFTALEQSQEAIEITSEDQVIQVHFDELLCDAVILSPSRSHEHSL